MPLFGEELVTRTKFIAPSPRRAHLDRERLYRRLDEVGDVRLGLVVAGTGYGKSSLLSGYLRARAVPSLWYELAEGDADPQLFAIHLAHLVHRAYPGAADRALDWLAKPGGARMHGEAAVDALADALLDRLEADTWLVLDDVHLLAGAGALALLDRLVLRRPPRLHVVLAARQKPALPDLPRWRLQDEVVELDQAELAFDDDELRRWLADGQGLALDATAIAEVAAETEGWPMALALVARRLRERAELPTRAGTRADLFEYLAREVLDKLDAPARDFLLAVAPLARLEPALCEAITGCEDARARLRELDERGLFLIPQAEGYRLHHLFREFLLARLAERGGLAEAHRTAGAALLAAGRLEEAVEQWLAAGDLEAAAGVMAMAAPALVGSGRFAQLDAWLAGLPDDLLARAPALAIHQGDACRLSGRFDEALGWYERALAGYAASPDGRSRALAGQALVYLDTLQPAHATRLLEEAIACAPPERQAELMGLLAENKLNHGDAAGALALFPALRARPEAREHEARVCLRTGRLADARAILRPLAAATPSEAGTRAHREPALVLALVEALEGDASAALALAEGVAALARERAHPWTEAVAWIRMGHAHLIAGDAAAAAERYRAAIARAEGVKRLQAEPLMGLTLVAGRRGDLVSAEAHAKEALEATRATGDAWVCAMLELALGAVYAAAGDARGAEWLSAADADYAACGDAFGRALAAIARARLAVAGHGDAGARVAEARQLVAAGDFGRVLERASLLGFESEAAATAFATSSPDVNAPLPPGEGGRKARTAPFQPGEGERGAAMRPHPPESPTRGFGIPLPGGEGRELLHVHTLGRFAVSRGNTPLSERAWGREKARQLFQLLVIHRGQRLPKSRLIDLLWPDLDPTGADGIFRVALNALNKALEPDRPGRQPTRFVVRDGATYGLGPDVAIDASAFERLLDEARTLPDAEAVPRLRQALALYEGAFLPDADHEDALAERERLAGRYTDGAIRLARSLARLGDDAGCAEWASRLIARDPCSEEAYRLLMIAQYRQGDRGLAIRTYDRCVVALSDELDVDPMPETQALYQAIGNAQPIAL